MLGLVFTFARVYFCSGFKLRLRFLRNELPIEPYLIICDYTHTMCIFDTRSGCTVFPPLPPPHPPTAVSYRILCEICGRMEKKTYVTVRLTQYHFYTSSTAFLYVLLPNYRLQLFFLPQIPNGFSIEPISIWEESQLRQILLSHDAFGHLTDQPTD